jgi:hypothetical protein
MLVLALRTLARRISRHHRLLFPSKASQHLLTPHRTLVIRLHPSHGNDKLAAYNDKVARKDLARERQQRKAVRNAMASSPAPNTTINTTISPPQPTTVTTATTSTATEKFVFTYYVPTKDRKAVNEAVHKTGAGTWPGDSYGETCFISQGAGQFRPLEGANPAIGKVGELEFVQESKVEMVVFGREIMVAAVAALKEAHPYEVVAYSVVKAEDI